MKDGREVTPSDGWASPILRDVKDDPTRFAGDIPESYDRGMGPVMFEAYADQLAELVASRRPRRILELAAGTGISTAAIASKIPDAELVATDLNADMIAIAKKKVPNVTTETADAASLHYADDSFDLVACQFGVMFLPDLKAGFREAHRVLTAEGSYCFSVWDGFAHNEFAGIYSDLLREEFPDDPPPFWNVPYHLGDIDPVTDLLQKCGFGRITVTMSPHTTSVPSWDTFTDGVVRGNPGRIQLTDRGADLTTISGRLRDRLTKRFGEAPTTLRIQAIFYEARPA